MYISYYNSLVLWDLGCSYAPPGLKGRFPGPIQSSGLVSDLGNESPGAWVYSVEKMCRWGGFLITFELCVLCLHRFYCLLSKSQTIGLQLVGVMVGIHTGALTWSLACVCHYTNNKLAYCLWWSLWWRFVGHRLSTTYSIIYFNSSFTFLSLINRTGFTIEKYCRS